LLKALDQKQREVIVLAEKSRQVIKSFKEISIKYCDRHCPYSDIENGSRIQKLPCEGEKELNLKPCKNYEKQNEFFELWPVLLRFIQRYVGKAESETGL